MALFWCQDMRTKLVQEAYMAKQDDYVRITLRLPPGLHKDLVELAGPASLNAYIVLRLEEAVANERSMIATYGSEEPLPHPDGISAADLEAENLALSMEAFERRIRSAIAEALREVLGERNRK